jgi:hypothetical protein
MNLLLSNKIKLLDRRRFFSDAADQPCWIVEFQKADRRRQCKWKVGVHYMGEKEEHLVGLTSFEVENNDVWSNLTSKQFAIDLLDIFKSGGIKSVKEWVKDESV